MSAQVLAEVKSAYADCWMNNFSIAAGIRNLHFRASESVTPNEALLIARAAIPGGYNAFDPDLLSKFPADCRIVFAREYSVCLYVKEGATPIPGISELSADEYDDDHGYIRIWWD